MPKSKPAAAPNVSRGFNTIGLADPGVDELLQSYDQVQFRNGNQNLLLQRAVNGTTVQPHADVSAGGALQVVPDAGPKAAAYAQAQKAGKSTPVWEKYGLYIGGAALLAGGLWLILRK